MIDLGRYADMFRNWHNDYAQQKMSLDAYLRPPYLSKDASMKGVSIKLKDQNRIFDNLPFKPIVINDIMPEYFNETQNGLQELLRTKFKDVDISVKPSCGCGKTSGILTPSVCPHCNSKVERSLDRTLESRLWVRAPKQVGYLINTRFLSLLIKDFSPRFRRQKFNLVEFFINDSCKLPTNMPLTGTSRVVTKTIDRFRALGVDRTIKSFHDNFDDIMQILLAPDGFLGGKAKLHRRMSWLDFIEKYRDAIFVKALPYPSKDLMVVDQKQGSDVVDRHVTMLMGAFKEIARVDNPFIKEGMTDRKANNRVAKYLFDIVGYYENFYSNVAGRKKGLFRRGLGSATSHYVARATLCPIIGAHKYYDCEMPYPIVISLLRSEIFAKLLHRGYTQRQITRKVDEAAVNVCPEILGIMNELIEESEDPGICVAILRNPILDKLGNQIFFITKIITEKDSNAIRLSNTVIKGPNADYDGDQMMIMLLRDRRIIDMFKRMLSPLGIMSQSNPDQIHHGMVVHAESATLVSNALRHAKRKIEELTK